MGVDIMTKEPHCLNSVKNPCQFVFFRSICSHGDDKPMSHIPCLLKPESLFTLLFKRVSSHARGVLVSDLLSRIGWTSPPTLYLP